MQTLGKEIEDVYKPLRELIDDEEAKRIQAELTDAVQSVRNHDRKIIRANPTRYYKAILELNSLLQHQGV